MSTANTRPLPSSPTETAVAAAVAAPIANIAVLAGVPAAAATSTDALPPAEDSSISTEALMNGIDMSIPGEVQTFVEDEEQLPSNEKTGYLLFLGKSIGINVEDILQPLLATSGKKKMVKVTKAMLSCEIKRRDSDIRVNKKNTSLQAMWDLLPALTDQRDINFIRTSVDSICNKLLAAHTASANQPETANKRREGKHVLRMFLLITQEADLRRAYMRSQDSSTREMLDAGETHMSEFLKLMVEAFNDPTKEVSTSCVPSLHSSFAEPIECNKDDFELTAEKAKKIISDSRRHLTTMINKYERSGNGSNQRRLEDDDGSDEEVDMDLWGRFDPEIALEAAREKGDDTTDGDDRASFLKNLPYYWLMVWHICDQGDLLRFTCAQLREEHGASSDSTPNAASQRGGPTSARKLAKQTYDLQKEMATNVKNIGRAVERLSSSQDRSFERACKIRRLDTLKGDRYLVFKDTKNPHYVDAEKEAAVEYLKELDATIAKIEEELAGDA